MNIIIPRSGGMNAYQGKAVTVNLPITVWSGPVD